MISRILHALTYSLTVTIGLGAQQPRLLKDINTVPGVKSSEPRHFTTVGTWQYFSAVIGMTGRQLFRTRVPGPVERLEAIPDGFIETDPVPEFLALGNTLFFVATDAAHGRELWANDAATGRSRLLYDSDPGPESGSPALLTAMGGHLYFVARGAVWRSDGTTAGTRIAKAFGSFLGGIVELARIGNELVFAADGGNGLGHELWKSDGTSAGTVFLKDLAPGPLSGWSSRFTTVGNEVYFFTSLFAGNWLWKTDGTTAGTVKVKASVGGMRIGASASLGGELIYTQLGNELWKSGGTNAGTVLLNDFPGIGDISGFTELGGRLYFSGGGLWTTDGTVAGTQPVGTTGIDLGVFARSGNQLYFTAGSRARIQLWISDGTGGGTRFVRDLGPQFQGITRGMVALPGGGILFDSNDGARGLELWVSDGTATGTVAYANLNPDTNGNSMPRGFFDLGDTLLFSADDGVHGLWRTDGTRAGTKPLIDRASGRPPIAAVTGSRLGNQRSGTIRDSHLRPRLLGGSCTKALPRVLIPVDLG